MVFGTIHFKFKNTDWLLLVNDMLCYSFGFYLNYAAWMLNAVKETHFYVLCIEQINYAHYIKNVLLQNNVALLTKHYSYIIF